MKIKKIIKKQEIIPVTWDRLVFGGTDEKPWFVPFGHDMANNLNVCGGKGGNSARQYQWIEMGIGRSLTPFDEEQFNEKRQQLISAKARVPFSYVATDFLVDFICRKFGVDSFYTLQFATLDKNNIQMQEMEAIGRQMHTKIMSIIGGLSDEAFNKMADAELDAMGVLEPILAIEQAIQVTSIITGMKCVSTRSNGVKEDGLSKGFHGKGKTTLYRINPLEIFRGCLISISSRYENAWLWYVYENCTAEEKASFDVFTTEFAVLIMHMIPYQIEGGTTWTVQATSGNDAIVNLQKTVKNGEASVGSRGGADEYVFDKELLLKGKRGKALVSKEKGLTLEKLVRNEATGETEFVETTPEERNNYLLTDDEAADQALTCVIIDEFCGRTTGDYENGKTLYKAGEEVIIAGKLAIENGEPVIYSAQTVILAEDYVEHYLVQGRPTTLTLLPRDKDISYKLGTASNNFDKSVYAKYKDFEGGVRAGSPYKNVAKGVVVFGDIHDEQWAGMTMEQVFHIWEEPVRAFAAKHNMPVNQIPKIGIFTETTNAMEPYMHGYVFFGNFNGGNPNSHTMGYAGEANVLAGYNIMKLPAVGEFYTIDAENGMVFYKKELPYTIEQTDISNMPVSPIEISAISGVRSDAGNISYRFNRPKNNMGGKGLARLESLYAALVYSPFVYYALTNGTYWDLVEAYIQSKNMDESQALHERADAQKIQIEVIAISRAYSTPLEYFQHQLRYFVATDGVFNKGHKVVTRACDYKWAEFAKQPGAKYFIKQFESLQQPKDKLRGAMLLTHPASRFIVEAEMQAIKYVREEMGYDHVYYEYAYVRQLREMQALDAIAEKVGIDPAKNYLMLELGSNFVQGERYLMYMAEKALKNGAYQNEYVPRLGRIVKVAIAQCKQGGNDTESNLTDTDRLAGAYTTRQESEEINHDSSALACMHRDAVFQKTGIYIKLGYCGNAVSLNYKVGLILMKNGYDSVSVTPYNMIKVCYALAGVEIDGEQTHEEVPVLFERSVFVA